MKKNWTVIAGGVHFMMGGTVSLSRAEALREARLIWADVEISE